MPNRTGASDKEESKGSQSANGRPKDMGKKLKHLCATLDVAVDVFVNEMNALHRSRKEDVRDWLNGKAVRAPSIEKLTKYWNGKLNGFGQYLWFVVFDHFRKDVDRLRSHANEVLVPFPCANDALTEAEIEGLSGCYVSYRKSFANDGRASRERLVLRPAADGSRVRLDAEMHAMPVDDPPNGAVLSEDDAGDLFSGHLFRLGANYYIALSLRNGDDCRIRFLSVPVGPRPARRRRWGIMTGVAGYSKLPVASRVLLHKLGSDVAPPALCRDLEAKIGLDESEARFISNDICKPLATFQKDSVLTVSAELE